MKCVYKKSVPGFTTVDESLQIDDNSCVDFSVDISLIQQEEFDDIFGRILNKIRHGGRIEVENINLYILCTDIITNDVHFTNVNSLLPHIKGFYYRNEVMSFLQSKNFSIEKSGMNDINWYIVGYRK